jgi:flagellar motor switch protein FliN/FliY
MPDSLQTSVALKWLADEFAGRLVQVLDSMTDQQHTCDWSPDASDSAVLTWWEFPLRGAAAGAFYIGASQEGCVQLGRSVLTAAGVDSDPETATTTFCEVLAQVLSALGQSITSRLGAEATFAAPALAARPDELARATLSFTLTSGRTPVAELLVAMAGSVVTALAAERKTQPSAAAPPAQNPPAPQSGGDTAATAARPTLDLLLDVELPVSVSFGRTQLQLRDVMKLSSGSIVELNRGISELVEVIVNNCVIARGEVVVIEGNYGVRIDEIISPQERLRTLR